jgi:pyruvate dehydrogenase E1 component beta subunit
MRKIKYVEAINEAFHQMMEKDERVFVIGVGVNSPWYVGQSMVGLWDKFGDKRVIDPPVSENAITGIAIGAAMAGMRPVVIHPRMDFMYLAMDQIVNHAAHWHYMFGGKVNVPVVIRGIINRGGEQAAQHSQALHGLFAHIPGLKIVMPSTPYDAKGLLVASILDDNPVIYIDDRWLYEEEGEVPEEIYSVPIGKAVIKKKGSDVTVVATSYMVVEALKAAELLEKENIRIEVIDLMTIKPIDKETLFNSVKKTGRLIVVDASWRTCGISSEICSLVQEEFFEYLNSPILRVTLPDTPAPASSTLEKVYYPRAEDIVTTVRKLIMK